MNNPADQNTPKWIGPLMLGLSIFIAFQKTSAGVPQWIGYVAALSFFLAGIAATEMAFGTNQLANIVGPLMMACLAIIPTWIAFGPGERHCSGGLSVLGFGWHQQNTGETECRVVFGFAAILIWTLLIWGIRYTMAGKKNRKNIKS